VTRAALIATILAVGAAAAPLASAADAPATRRSPLIAYAAELSEQESRSDVRTLHNATSALRAITFEMSRHPPPRDEECAQTLGASRFAEQYAQLATIHDELGDFEAVIRANESALACRPRTASYEASIASAHVNLDRLSDARGAAERAHTLDPDDPRVRDVRARLDFLQERWADAIARFRVLTLEDDSGASSPITDYARCYFWLAQRRAGVRKPEMPAPPRTAATRVQDDEPQIKRWPTQILETLRGELNEDELVEVIRGTAESRRREWLTEAAFYVGELRLAEGDTETARQHFATVVNLRVLNFVEYGMARAELKKMRDRAPVADAATSQAESRTR
jgi:tetratricopeptide (TPR) repeat protein